jgi:hypothetical protein
MKYVILVLMIAGSVIGHTTTNQFNMPRNSWSPPPRQHDQNPYVPVNGYVKPSNGEYVNPYTRTKPNPYKQDNFSFED